MSRSHSLASASPPTRARDEAYRWLVGMCRQWLLGLADHHAESQPAPLPSGGDHATLARMAQIHGLEPLLHHLGQALPTWVASLPTELVETWKRAYYVTLVRNTELLTSAARIGARCEAEDVPVMVLKGPATIAALYHDIGLRPMADLDLLGHLPDLPRLGHLLHAEGFEPRGRLYLYAVDFVHPRERRLLELHFAGHPSLPGRAAFLERAWQGRCHAVLEGWTFPVMAPEDQVVFEYSHCAWDDFELPLRRLVDFAGRLTRHAAHLRPEVVAERVEEAGVADNFWLFVHAVDALFDLDLNLVAPPGCTSSLAPERIESFRRRLTASSENYGFVKERRAGGGLARQRTPGAAFRYSLERLFPPLPALQAAYGLGSPAGALAYLPIHVGKVTGDVLDRLRRGV